MISFIIPTYNEEKAIEDTLQRIRKEFTLVPYELIVADDSSKDHTVEIAKKYADKVLVGANITIGANRNRGAAAAIYPYLVFLDSGVRVPNPNEFFQIALDNFKQNPKLVALSAKVHIEPALATFADKFWWGFNNIWFTINNNLLHNGLATGKFHMIKADVFKQSKGYDESLAAGEDNDLFARLSKLGPTGFETRLTVYHLGRREHALGWPHLLFLWVANGLWVILFKKSYSKEWKAVR